MDVELDVNKTIKLDVAVETIGCSPNSSKSGPIINPPPMPNNPAITPEINEYKGYLINILLSQTTSCLL